MAKTRRLWHVPATKESRAGHVRRDQQSITNQRRRSIYGRARHDRNTLHNRVHILGKKFHHFGVHLRTCTSSVTLFYFPGLVHKFCFISAVITVHIEIRPSPTDSCKPTNSTNQRTLKSPRVAYLSALCASGQLLYHMRSTKFYTEDVSLFPREYETIAEKN